MIDHPLDPEAKYLVLSSVESSERLNIYAGTADLDADGRARVELPAWFTAVNADVHYQLTPIGAPGASLYIEEEVDHARMFVVAGGTAGGKVSWQVTGVRNDPYARAHPLEVEIEKPAAEEGTFLHPVEHGASEARGRDYERIRRMRQLADQRPLPTRGLGW